jgi:hypothetical protein
MIYCFCRILLEYFARFLRIFADVGVPEEILLGEDSREGDLSTNGSPKPGEVSAKVRKSHDSRQMTFFGSFLPR